MCHILIPYKENASIFSSLKNIETFCISLSEKSCLFFDEYGNESPSAGSINTAYLLIENCSVDEFVSSILFGAVVYKVINNNELIRPDENLLNKNIILKDSFKIYVDPLCLHLKKYDLHNDDIKPLLPFIVIKYLASNYLFNFIKNSICSVNSNDQENTLASSCINTAYAVSLIFYGESMASSYFNTIKKLHTCDLNITLPSKIKWKYQARGLFDGDIAREILNDINYDEKNLNRYAIPYINLLFDYTQPSIDECCKCDNDEMAIQSLNRYFSNIKYNFNINIINCLKSEIQKNCKNVSNNNTHVYFVLVIIPEKRITDSQAIEHAFIIEQFYLRSDVQFRIYQSWVNQATLYNDIVRRKYGDLGESSMNLSEMEDFLNNFSELYSNNRPLSNITSEKCFGYVNNSDKLPLTRFEENILSGTSIRYFSKNIVPHHCLKNFYGFFRKNNSLFKAEQQTNTSSPNQQSNLKMMA